jgi:hypothetical protein
MGRSNASLEEWAAESGIRMSADRVPRIHHVRSTMLLSSRSALSRSGSFDAYEAKLSPATRAALTEMVAGTWLPIELALEHYAACDALQLSHTSQQSLGRTNADLIRGTLMGTVARIARTAGSTPITIIEQMPRFWARIFDGGSVTNQVRGPKEADLFVTADPVLRSEYFRHGLLGFAEMMLGLMTTRLYVRVHAFDVREAKVVFRAQWV